mmetsp:Transcript_14171/g.16041  ORF Transcript_14171/g.16041 Transcript_14171/m.16041 type:complete len:991 (+) Transcript_14171:123-3095(+)
MKTVLIGKGRRVTLEELRSVCFEDGQLEMHSSSTDNSNNATVLEAHVSGTYNALKEILSESAMPRAPGTGSMSIDKLEYSHSIGCWTLLALNISQNRISPGTCSSQNNETAAAIVQLVNTAKTLDSGHRKIMDLPSSSTKFFDVLISLLPTYPSVQTHIESIKSSHLTSIFARILPLTLTSLATIQTSQFTKNSLIDVFAALSVERTATPTDTTSTFHDSNYDLHRPHRGMISSASVVRVLTQGSKFATSNKNENKTAMNVYESMTEDVKLAMERIPAYHGPGCDVIATAMKVLELECNCFEHGEDLDTTVIALTCQTVSNAVQVLWKGCLARMGEQIDVNDATTSPNDLLDKSYKLYLAMESLRNALQKEIKMNINFIRNQNALATESHLKKVEEKAARAAAIQAANAAATTGNAEQKDEFEGMSEGKKNKILKKRREKEAKAAKKAAKTGKVEINMFGAGTMAVVSTFLSSFSTDDPAILSSFLSTDNDGPTLNENARIKTILFHENTFAQIETILSSLLSGGIQRKPKIAKGTRDYLPEQMMIRDQAFQIIRRVFKSHGAVEIDTPVFELKETLTGKYGEDSKLIYDLADQGGELLALRYDLTVPFARFLSLNNVGNIKRFHIGKVYRRDQPQLSKGRYREFYQCDFDIAGSYGRMVPDSECLCVASEILASLPIGDFGIKLNHRRLLDAILDLCGVPADKFRTICSAVDKLDKEPWSEVKREMVEDKGLEADVADKIGVFVVQKGKPWDMYNSLMDTKVFGTHKGALNAMEDLRILFEYLDAMDKLKYISFDLSLARGLDYYTGVIYEAVCMNGNTQVGSIGGGGRYDTLVSMFQEAGNNTPCVGVSVGIERVFTLMEERLRQEQGGSIKQPNVKVLIAQAGENMMLERMKLAKLLWDSNISAEFNQKENPKLTSEITNALDRNIPFMVIIGDEEAKEKKCKVKDLNARTEETVDQKSLVAILRQKGVIPVGCEFAAEMLAAEKEE